MPPSPPPAGTPIRRPGLGKPAVGRKAEPDPIPPVVRTVLLVSFVASIAALGLLGIIHAFQNPDRLPRSVETDPHAGAIPADRNPATG